MRLLVTLAVMSLPALAWAQGVAGLNTDQDRLSYALGMDLGAQLRRQGVQIDPLVFARGLQDALAGANTQMTEDEVRSAIAKLQATLKNKQLEAGKAAAGTNKADGETYLAVNKTQQDVVTLPSGLQYKILTPATGRRPTAADTVVCQYRGTLIDGTEFDSSYKRGQPATFPVSGVIRGWTEALQLMPVGSKWRVFIPPALAYGERGSGPIGPNATLVFDIELLAIK